MKCFVVIASLALLLVAIEAVRIPIRYDDSDSPVKDDQTKLKQLASRIVQAGAINAAVLGDPNTWNYMWKGLSMNSTAEESFGLGINISFPLDGITFNIITQNGQYELVVQATADVWGHASVPIQLTFLYDSSGDLEMAFQFSITSWINLPHKMIPNNTRTNPNVTSWYDGVTFIGPNSFTIATDTFTDLDNVDYERGITIIATVDASKIPIAGDLGKMIFGPQKPNQPLKATITAYFPIDPNDALAYFNLTFDETLNFFSSAVEAKQLTLALTVDTAPSVELTTIILVVLESKTLVFNCVANVGLTTGIVWTGVLQNPPFNDAFGLSWLSFTDMTVTFQLNPYGLMADLNMVGDAALKFSTQPEVHTTIDVSLNENGADAVLTLQTSILGVVDLFDDVLGRVPPNADQISVTGQVTLTLATSDGQTQEGLTIDGNAAVGGAGNLSSTIAALNSYSKTPLNYLFHLYVPLFSTTPEDIDFRLSEVDPIPLSNNAVMNNIVFEFSVQPNAQVQLSTQLAITFDHEPQPRVFDLSGLVNDQVINFNGEMEGLWNHPFGITWLQISDITVNMVYSVQEQKLVSFDVNADYNATIVLSMDPTIVISFQGDFHHFTFTLTVYISNAKNFFDAVLGSEIAPSLSQELSMECSLIVSNQDGGSYVDGITLQGQVIIAPAGKIGTAIRSLDPGAQLSFDATIGIPIWGSGPPLVEFDFAETGTVHLASNVVLSGFDLHFEISPNPDVSLQSQGNITFNHNSGSLAFDLSADLNAASFGMSGNLVGVWTKPFGLPWLHIDNLEIQMGFNNFQIESITLSGTASIDFSSHGQNVQITISTDPTYANIMLEAQAIGVVNLAAVVQTIWGSVPAVIADLTSVDNSVDLIFATYSGTVNGQSFQSGITISDDMSTTGDVLKRLKVFNRNNSPSMYFNGSLTIPIYATVPDIAVSLSTNIPITISNRAVFEELSVSISLAPLTFSVSAIFDVTYSNNPTMQFQVSGSLGVDGSISFNGIYNGQWNDIFGYADLTAYNVDLDLGMNPALCGVDLCISQLGMGFNITLGTRNIAFYGFVDIPEIEKIFIEAIVPPSGMDLSFRDVASGYNSLVGNKYPNLNPQNYPSEWGLTYLYFFLAPEAGTFDNIHYDPGFYMIGQFILLGVDCSVNISISETDFYFHVNYSVDTFNQMVNNAIGQQLAMHPEDFTSWDDDVIAAYLLGSNQMPGSGKAIVQVNAVSLHKVSCNGIAQNQNPNFKMEYTLFGGDHKAALDVNPVALYSDFSYFYKTYLENLFS